jgi:hypothetical protein
MEIVQIPLKNWKKIERVLEKLDRDPIDWINEDQARELLGKNGKKLAQGTIYNMRLNKKITSDMYKEGVNGSIFYNKQRLMGL